MEEMPCTGNHRNPDQILFLTLVVVPVMYAIFDKLLSKLNKGKNKQPVTELMNASYKLKDHMRNYLIHHIFNCEMFFKLQWL